MGEPCSVTECHLQDGDIFYSREDKKKEIHWYTIVRTKLKVVNGNSIRAPDFAKA